MELEFKGTKGEWVLNEKHLTIVDESGMGIAQEHGISNPVRRDFHSYGLRN